VQLNLIKQETLAASVLYPYIQPLAPKIMNVLGAILPFLKNMFSDLEVFFEGISHKVNK
jgi:membrane protein required for colicin V production